MWEKVKSDKKKKKKEKLSPFTQITVVKILIRFIRKTGRTWSE